MDITYLGHSSFRIHGKSSTVVTDPYDSSYVGIKFPKHIAADIVTISHDHKDHNNSSEIEGNPFIISGPGEYEVNGVSVVGVSTYHDSQKGKERGRNTLYHMVVDGVSIVHAGDLGHTLTADQKEEIGNVHILMVPVGGVYTITSDQAVELITELEPNIVIPMHYKKPELSEAFKDLTDLSAFFKELNKEQPAPVSKFVITKDKLPEELQVVVFE